jgi:hypothetical protein
VLALISVRITGLKALESYGHSLFFMSHEASNPAGEAKYAMFSAQMPNLYGFFHSICVKKFGDKYILGLRKVWP